MRKFALSAAIAFVAVACKSAPSEPAGADAGFAPVTVSAQASTSAAPPAASASSAPLSKHPAIDAFCASAYGADLELLKSRCTAEEMKTQETFATAAAKNCGRDLALLEDRGGAKLDAKNADACVAMLKTASKPDVKLHEGETFFGRAPCDRVLVGQRGENEACRFPPECKDGLACAGYAVGVDGACKKPAKIGAACTRQGYGATYNELALDLHHAPCVKGAYCTDAGKCAARAKLGEACAQEKACVEGSFCTAGKCSKAPFVASGEACLKTADCAFGLFCDATKKCAPKRAAGEPCTDDQCKGYCDVPPKATEGKCAQTCSSG